jgi:superfamily I DNA/RNA helicase
MSFPVPQGRQREVVYLPEYGHTVVLGTAGSGKTTMAILRANYLAELSRDGTDRVLLVTFNKALVTYLHTMARAQRISPRIDVRNYHHFARGYLHAKGLMRQNAIASFDARQRLIQRAIQTVRSTLPDAPVWQYPAAFFAEECMWIAGCAIKSVEEYVDFRCHPDVPELTVTACDCIFQVYQHYQALRAQTSYLYDWDDIAHVVEQMLTEDQTVRYYRHVVIDEGQDFTPAMLRSLALAIPSDGSLTFFGDMAQQIYGNRISWRMAGLHPAQPWEFRENYRNTRQIAALCLALTKTDAFKGTVDLVIPRQPQADGPLPVIVHCATPQVERDLVVEQARALAPQQSVAILLRRREDANAYRDTLGRSSVHYLHRDLSRWSPQGISVGTYHAAKGFEFDAVILPQCTAERLPDGERLGAFASRTDGLAQEARLLYVSLSRARTRLILTHTGPLTPLLPQDKALYQWENR